MDQWVLKVNLERGEVLGYLGLKEAQVTLVGQEPKVCKDQEELSEDLECQERLVLKERGVFRELMAGLVSRDLREYKVHLV